MTIARFLKRELSFQIIDFYLYTWNKIYRLSTAEAYEFCIISKRRTVNSANVTTICQANSAALDQSTMMQIGRNQPSRFVKHLKIGGWVKCKLGEKRRITEIQRSECGEDMKKVEGTYLSCNPNFIVTSYEFHALNAPCIMYPGNV